MPEVRSAHGLADHTSTARAKKGADTARQPPGVDTARIGGVARHIAEAV